jgi:hypothetical protein
MKIRYYVNPKSKLIKTAVAFLALSIILRLCWCIMFPEQISGVMLVTQVLLPLAACVLFIVFLLKYGQTAFWTTFIPAFMGVVFFIVKATGFVWWHQLLCTLLYLLVAALYGLTAFGVLPIRRLLIPLFGLPLVFHIFVEDAIINRATNTAANWLQEGSVLCIMVTLLMVSLAIKKPGE